MSLNTGAVRRSAAQPARRVLAVRRARSKIARVLTYLILGLGAITMVVPFYWMVVTSFKVRSEVLAFPPVWIPHSPTLANYTRMLSAINVPVLAFFLLLQRRFIAGLTAGALRA